MAGSTTNYGFTFPTSTDLVKNGATDIQGLANSIDTWLVGSGIASTGKAFNAVSYLGSTDQSTTSTASTEKTGITTTFTTGKSGLVLVIATIAGYPSTASESVWASTKIYEGTTSGTVVFNPEFHRGVRFQGTSSNWGVGTFVRLFDFTPNVLHTMTLVMASSVGTSTANVTETNFQILTLA